MNQAAADVQPGPRGACSGQRARLRAVASQKASAVAQPKASMFRGPRSLFAPETGPTDRPKKLVQIAYMCDPVI
jgi:hypothetical protein